MLSCFFSVLYRLLTSIFFKWQKLNQIDRNYFSKPECFKKWAFFDITYFWRTVRRSNQFDSPVSDRNFLSNLITEFFFGKSVSSGSSEFPISPLHRCPSHFWVRQKTDLNQHQEGFIKLTIWVRKASSDVQKWNNAYNVKRTTITEPNWRRKKSTRRRECVTINCAQLKTNSRAGCHKKI